MKKIFFILFIIVLISLGMWLLFTTNPQTNDNTTDSRTLYQNDIYGFSLMHPDTWQVVYEEGEITPKITVYETLRDNQNNPPLNHLVNETHASVYPKGIPTEGLFGESIPLSESDLNISPQLSNDSKIYTLKDGTPFAAYLKLASDVEEKNENWNDSGFIWIRAYVDNQSTECLNETGVKLERNECDPLTKNHTIIRNGSVKDTEWKILVLIAESFSLLDYTENKDITNKALRIEQPKENTSVTSPLEIEGEVRGTWLFEGSASVILKNANDEVLAEGIIEAQEDWMTEDFVPFSATLTFDSTDTTDTGTLLFEKANPSGLPENDDAIEYTVRFE